MTMLALEETEIASEKCRCAALMQERNNLLVLNSLAPDFMADLMDANPPATQDLALAVRDIFIEDDHDLADSVPNSGA